MLDLRPIDLERALDIIQRHAPHMKVWAFGSRVNGTAKKFSDLDLALDAGREIGLLEMGDLREAFQESDLPISVDLVDLSSVRKEFRKIIDAQRVPLWMPENADQRIG